MTPARPRLRALLIALPAMVAVAIVAVLVTFAIDRLDDQRETESRAAERAAAVLAGVLTEHVQRSFEQADVLAKLVGQRIVDDGFAFDLRELAQKGVIPLDVFLQVASVDDKGILRQSTVEGFKPIDLSDREHIKIHLAQPDHGPFVSKPLLGRASGKWSIQYSRAVLDGSGKLIGAVVVSIDPTYFSGFYRQVDIGEHGSISLIGIDDRTVRTRRSGSSYTAGQEIPSDTQLFKLLRQSPRGSYRGLSTIDQRSRFFGYDSLRKYPFAVVVGLDRDDYLATYEKQRSTLLASVTAVSVVLLIMGFIGTLGVVRVFREVDLKAVARDDARRLAEQLTTVIEAAPDGFLIIDGRMQVAGSNQAFFALSGMTEAQIHHRPLQAVLDEWIDARGFDTHLNVDELFSTLTIETGHQGEIQRIVIARRKPPQQVVELRARRLATGHPGFILIARDITHETEVDRMKSEFIATAAHELRTPMASIHGFSELLAHGRVPAERQQAMLDIIQRQSSRMTDLLNDLLDLARIEARSDLDFQYEVIDLREIAANVIDEFGYLSGERKLMHDMPPGAVRVRCDRAKLAQAVRNLLGNAFKFSEAPAPIAVLVGTETSGRFAFVEVRDAGIGMTAEQQTHLFQRFYRADKSGHVQGSGLGLALVKTIVELHGGSVRIDSKSGVGTTATLLIPLADSLAAAPSAPHRTESA